MKAHIESETAGSRLDELVASDPIHVLCIEDDKDFVTWLEGELGDRSPSIRMQVGDGQQEVEQHLSDDIDCVLVDHVLEGTDGITLLKDIRNAERDLPVILMTGYGSERIASEAIRHGVTDYIPKNLVANQPTLVGDRIEMAALSYRRRELTAALNRIQRVTGEINRRLVHADTVTEVDTAVCEVISSAEPYVFAWIGDHDSEAERVEARSFAGIEEGYLDAISITTDETETAQGPTGRAVLEREIAVMQDIPTDPEYEPWREHALERGYRSSAAIPLEHDGNLYGVLNVYANRVGAFSAPELELLERVGETIAAAMRRVTVEEELRRTELAVENAADAIFITDPDGVIEYVNPGFESLTGYEASEALGRTPRILKSGEMSDHYYASMWETIRSAEIWHGEITNERKSGDHYVAEQTIAPITDESETIEGFVAVQRDITERKERERQIERQRNRLRVLFDGAPDGIVVHDAAGTVYDVNETLAEMLGYSREELLSMKVNDFEVGIETDRLRERWQAMEPGPVQKITVDGQHRRKDGSTYPVDVWVSKIEVDAASSDRYIAIVRNISDRKDRQQRLELFERAVEEAGHAVIITDRESEIEYVNPAFEAMTGFSKSDAVGKTPRILKSGTHAETFYRDLWETILEGDVWRAELENRAADGSLIHVDQTIAPVTDDDGTITHFVGIESEITERRLREQRLDVMMRILRHNLRNSMNIVLGRSDNIIQELDNASLRKQFESIHAKAEALVALSEKALTVQQLFEGSDAEAMSHVNLDTCVQGIVTETTSAYPEASVTVQDDPLGTVRGDERLRFGIQEAVENAIVHSDQESPTIEISTRVSPEAEHELCELVIADDGPGIPPEQREAIERGKETSLMHATGLGLWVIEWAAATVGGEIIFEENDPRGTRLVFRLPQGSE